MYDLTRVCIISKKGVGVGDFDFRKLYLCIYNKYNKDPYEELFEDSNLRLTNPQSIKSI